MAFIALQERLIIVHRKNRNFKEIIGSNKILNYIVIWKKKAAKKHLFFKPYYTRRDNLCCKQVEQKNL